MLSKEALAELRKVPNVPAYAVTERDEEYRQPEDECWTISLSPDSAGWCTDAGYNGYGLTNEEAAQYVAAYNALHPLLSHIDEQQALIDKLAKALEPFTDFDKVIYADVLTAKEVLTEVKAKLNG